MPWTKPECTKQQASKAGRILTDLFQAGIEGKPREQMQEAFLIILNWRSSFGYPLYVITRTLAKRTLRINPNSLVAKRSKRFRSILSKLQRFPGIKLGEMQDLGGCRAILPSIEDVNALVEKYATDPCKTAAFRRKKDYIAKPKADGYRSVHLVYEYRTTHEKRCVYNGRQIEIQIRTDFQHAWATAVETIDTFKDRGSKPGREQQNGNGFLSLQAPTSLSWKVRPWCRVSLMDSHGS